MSFLCLPIEAHMECPHCDLLPCRCHIPLADEPEMANVVVGHNFWNVYECKACAATWTLGEKFHAWDPLPSPRLSAPTALASSEPPPGEGEGAP